MNRKEKEFQKWVVKANIIHQNKYDYSLVEYVNQRKKVTIICPIHGNFSQIPVDHTYKKHGCKRCGLENRKQTLLERYGVDNPSKSPEIQKQREINCLEKWGVAHPKKDPTVQQKQEQTCEDRYGHRNPAQGKEAKQKINETNMLRYNGHPLANKQVRDKGIQTKISKYNDPKFNNSEKRICTVQQRYGVDHISQLQHIIEQKKLTNIRNRGVTTPILCEEVKQKKTTTILNKYGVKDYNQKHLIDVLPFLSDYNWMYQQYVELQRTKSNIASQLNCTVKTVSTYLDNHNIPTIYTIFSHSDVSIEWLESIMESENIYIQHALNGGEFRIPGTRYRADGFCAATNTIYEFHGDYWHGNPLIYKAELYNHSTKCTMGELYGKTTVKENKIRELGYNLIVRWENHKY